jgi:hypothetical protein
MAVSRCLIRGLGKQSDTRQGKIRRQNGVDSLLIDFGLLGLALAEFEALEFSGGGFGELVEELDPARAFVAADAVGDKFLQFAG